MANFNALDEILLILPVFFESYLRVQKRFLYNCLLSYSVQFYCSVKALLVAKFLW